MVPQSPDGVQSARIVSGGPAAKGSVA
jgi:hypothetical protein